MPLACDCFDGCWGVHSKDWPSIQLDEATLAPFHKERYPSSHVSHLVREMINIPYGMHVTTKNELRFETEKLRDSALAALNTLKFE